MRAEYTVVCYIPDPGRGEALNVGVIVWSDEGYRVAVDSTAADRVIRENPHLAREALLYLEPHLRRTLDRVPGKPVERVAAVMRDEAGFPVTFTEPRFTTVDESDTRGLEATLERLVARIVRPKRRGAPSTPTLTDLLEQRCRQLIQAHRVVRNHLVEGARTGLTRTVDFWVNSGTNIALDTLKLDVGRADEIARRADAEAYKALDLLQHTEAFYVLCSFSPDADLGEASERARRVLKSAGALVLDNVASATTMLIDAAGPLGAYVADERPESLPRPKPPLRLPPGSA